MAQCEAVTLRGTPCTSNALRGRARCYQHVADDAAVAVRRRAARRRGGFNSRIRATAPVDGVTAETPAEVRRILVGELCWWLARPHSAHRTRVVADLCTRMLRTIEVESPPLPTAVILPTGDDALAWIRERIEGMAANRHAAREMTERIAPVEIGLESPGPLLPGDEDDHDEAGSAGRVRADDPDRRAIVRVGPRWITGGPLSAPPNLSDPPGRQSGRAAEYGYGTLGGK